MCGKVKNTFPIMDSCIIHDENTKQPWRQTAERHLGPSQKENIPTAVNKQQNTPGIQESLPES